VRRRDSWLFLTPEIEIEVPALVARLQPSRTALAEAARIEGLVSSGDAVAWFGYLRELRALAEQAHADGRDPPAVERLAAVLLEQHLLAPGAPGAALPADARERALLVRLLA
jgi:hypothetical protein